MVKKDFSTKWYDYVAIGCILITFGALVFFRSFSIFLGDPRSLERTSPTIAKIAFMLIRLEQPNERLPTVAFFMCCGVLFFYLGYRFRKKKKQG